ncbi:MAG: hypothetical protein HY261_05520 [Chloroflexi bacterium]|nr:hypothetical protein [Chloroflexota bacterium]
MPVEKVNSEIRIKLNDVVDCLLTGMKTPTGNVSLIAAFESMRRGGPRGFGGSPIWKRQQT